MQTVLFRCRGKSFAKGKTESSVVPVPAQAEGAQGSCPSPRHGSNTLAIQEDHQHQQFSVPGSYSYFCCQPVSSCRGFPWAGGPAEQDTGSSPAAFRSHQELICWSGSPAGLSKLGHDQVHRLSAYTGGDGRRGRLYFQLAKSIHN